MTGSPQRIGRYVVVRELGRGGMGEVYLAYSPAGDPVAVKLIRIDSLNEMTRKRFEKEALIARTVVGTNRVARFLDADPFADRPWLAMEYVPGKVLQAHVKEDGPLQPVLVASLGALLAEGISAVHSRGCCTATSSRRTSSWATTDRWSSTLGLRPSSTGRLSGSPGRA